MDIVRYNRTVNTRRASCTDPLTGLWNRRWFDAAKHRRWKGGNGRYLAVLLFDADALSDVNDRYGYAAGDACLVALSRAVWHSFGNIADVIRLGGDEFLVPLEVATHQTAARLARAALKAIAAVPELRQHRLRASAGIALTRVTASPDWGTLINHAYRALRRAKRAGGHRLRTLWA